LIRPTLIVISPSGETVLVGHAIGVTSVEADRAIQRGRPLSTNSTEHDKDQHRGERGRALKPGLAMRLRRN
jgi:hypothetical protein